MTEREQFIFILGAIKVPLNVYPDGNVEIPGACIFRFNSTNGQFVECQAARSAKTIGRAGSISKAVNDALGGKKGTAKVPKSPKAPPLYDSATRDGSIYFSGEELKRLSVTIPSGTPNFFRVEGQTKFTEAIMPVDPTAYLNDKADKTVGRTCICFTGKSQYGTRNDVASALSAISGSFYPVESVGAYNNALLIVPRAALAQHLLFNTGSTKLVAAIRVGSIIITDEVFSEWLEERIDLDKGLPLRNQFEDEEEPNDDGDWAP